jgi:AraC-like DNA-binding protein
LARLAILESDPRAAARLAAALGDRHALAWCRDLEHFWEIVLAEAVDGCVVDIYHPAHPLPLPELLRLRRRQPPLAIVVYADFENHEMDLFELGRLKVDGVILAGTNDHPSDTRAAVEGALSAAAALGVVAALDGQLHPFGVECLRWAVEHAEENPSADEMASAMGLTPGTLTRELVEHGLPSPGRILLWGRLFRAARLMSNPDRSIEETAFRAGYSSASALGRALRRETGHSPTELLRRGGLGYVLDAFLRREVRPRGRRRAP